MQLSLLLGGTPTPFWEVLEQKIFGKEKTSLARPCDHEGTFTLMNMCSDY